MTLLMGLPKPWPAFVSTRMSNGFDWLECSPSLYWSSAMNFNEWEGTTRSSWSAVVSRVAGYCSPSCNKSFDYLVSCWRAIRKKIQEKFNKWDYTQEARYDELFLIDYKARFSLVDGAESALLHKCPHELWTIHKIRRSQRHFCCSLNLACP